jgi:hypothetical protein
MMLESMLDAIPTMRNGQPGRHVGVRANCMRIKLTIIVAAIRHAEYVGSYPALHGVTSRRLTASGATAHVVERTLG